MQIRFKFACFEEIRDYAEQTPDCIINADLENWIRGLVEEHCDWEYL